VQLTGAESNHKKIRQEAVDFIRKNCDDFKPFIEDDFDAFLGNLGTLGEFAGNEALVAISRLYNCDIVIHQTGQSAWTVSAGESNAKKGPARQLHLAYHDWEHYSSIRKLNDSSHEPALVHIIFDPNKPTVTNHAVAEDDVKIELEDEEEKEETNETQKAPLSGKEKKRIRKQKAMEKRAKALKKEKKVPEIDESQIAPLSDTLQQLKI